MDLLFQEEVEMASLSLVRSAEEDKVSYKIFIYKTKFNLEEHVFRWTRLSRRHCSRLNLEIERWAKNIFLFILYVNFLIDLSKFLNSVSRSNTRRKRIKCEKDNTRACWKKENQIDWIILFLICCSKVWFNTQDNVQLYFLSSLIIHPSLQLWQLWHCLWPSSCQCPFHWEVVWHEAKIREINSEQLKIWIDFSKCRTLSFGLVSCVGTWQKVKCGNIKMTNSSIISWSHHLIIMMHLIFLIVFVCFIAPYLIPCGTLATPATTTLGRWWTGWFSYFSDLLIYHPHIRLILILLLGALPSTTRFTVWFY